MGPGGAERVMSRLVTHLAAKHTIILLTLEPQQSKPFYALPHNIEYIKADLLGDGGVQRFNRIFQRIKIIRKVIRAHSPDAIISFVDVINVMTIIAGFGTRSVILVSERIDPGKHNIGYIKSLACRLLYPFATFCIVQTTRIAAHLEWLPASCIKIIPNPIYPSSHLAKPDAPGRNRRFRVIAIGRLNQQKGFDVLIDAFAILADKQPLWDLVIFGEGDQRVSLERTIAKLDLSDRIKLLGLTSKPVEELASSNIMAFSSRYEGFPNALGEALSVGLPSVGFRNVSGVDDLIVHDETGILVDQEGNIEAFANALGKLMDDPALRTQMGYAAQQHSSKWTPKKILAQWDNLLSPMSDQ